MSWRNESPQQDPDIRKAWINWRTASVFGFLFVFFPVIVVFIFELSACKCGVETFIGINSDRYWQLMIKLAVLGILIYIPGSNLIVYLLTRQKRKGTSEQERKS
jgi:ABC-type sulfate transport system permease subunit